MEGVENKMEEEELETSVKTLEEFCCTRKRRIVWYLTGELQSGGFCFVVWFGFAFRGAKHQCKGLLLALI